MDSYISILRIIATFIIVLCHCFGYYGTWPSMYPDAICLKTGPFFNYICQFALVVFVVISGFLYAELFIDKGKYSNTLSFVLNKFRRLIVPYLIWSIVSILCMLEPDPILRILTGCHHLWFLLMLFGCFILIRLIDKKRLSNIKLCVGRVIFTILLYPILYHTFDGLINVFCWRSILEYMPCFLSGILMYNVFKNDNLSIPYIYIYIFACTFFSILIYSVDIPFSSFYKFVPFILIVSFIIFILRKENIILPKWLLNFEKNSLGIYIIHHILIHIVLLYVPFTQLLMNQHYIIAPISLLFFVIVTSWFLSDIIRRSNLLSWSLGVIRK